MKVDEILQSITAQGKMLELDTGIYYRILNKEQKHPNGNEFIWVVSEIVARCENGQMDPWDIDLMSLTQLFSGSIDNKSPNFSIAGRFIAESWKFLLEKSKNILYMPEQEDEIPEDIESSFLENTPYIETIEVKPRIYHPEKRKIMLLEVLESVRTFYQRPSFVRSKITEEPLPESSIEEIIVELNTEEPEAEKLKILSQILECDGDISMENIWGNTKSEKSSFFAYSLFLAKERRIRLIQEHDYGKILIHLMEDPNA